VDTYLSSVEYHLKLCLEAEPDFLGMNLHMCVVFLWLQIGTSSSSLGSWRVSRLGYVKPLKRARRLQVQAAVEIDVGP
jgi:hypothetical protein